jgi:hypothetical protein
MFYISPAFGFMSRFGQIEGCGRSKWKDYSAGIRAARRPSGAKKILTFRANSGINV